MTSAPEDRPRHNPLFAAAAGGGLGLLFLAIGLSRPTIADMRTIDLIHLLGTGGCLGVGLVGVVLYLRGRRIG